MLQQSGADVPKEPDVYAVLRETTGAARFLSMAEW
jgi:hypothetical protein